MYGPGVSRESSHRSGKRPAVKFYLPGREVVRLLERYIDAGPWHEVHRASSIGSTAAFTFAPVRLFLWGTRHGVVDRKKTPADPIEVRVLRGERIANSHSTKTKNDN